jgi:hypothetical protein
MDGANARGALMARTIRGRPENDNRKNDRKRQHHERPQQQKTNNKKPMTGWAGLTGLNTRATASHRLMTAARRASVFILPILPILS